MFLFSLYNAEGCLLHHPVLVRFVASILNDLELVWEWWVRKRCVNDWYIVDICVRTSVGWDFRRQRTAGIRQSRTFRKRKYV
jgi:hypothetical protein